MLSVSKCIRNPGIKPTSQALLGMALCQLMHVLLLSGCCGCCVQRVMCECLEANWHLSATCAVTFKLSYSRRNCCFSLSSGQCRVRWLTHCLRSPFIFLVIPFIECLVDNVVKRLPSASLSKVASPRSVWSDGLVSIFGPWMSCYITIESDVGMTQPASAKDSQTKSWGRAETP